MTNSGRILVLCNHFLSFLSENAEFFSTHSLDDLPEHLTRRMLCLEHCRFVTKLSQVFLELENIARGFDRFFCAVISEPPFIMSDALAEKVACNKDADHKMTISILFGKNQNMPKESEFLDKVGLRSTISQDVVKRRICDYVGVNVFVTEKKACIMFPFDDTTHKTDTTRILVGESKEFIDWCLEFFNHKQEFSEQIARPRT